MELLTILVALVVYCGVCLASTLAETNPLLQTTLRYKTTAEGLDIHIEVWASKALSYDHGNSIKRPAFIYFHGGGLSAGAREYAIPPWVFNRITERGYIFISADYRLLPPITGHEIIEDIKDLWEFVTSPELSITFPDSKRSTGRTLKIDSNAIAVGGSSAGGWCAFMTAIHCKNPAPKAIISMYGLGGQIFTSYYLSPKKEPFVYSFGWLDKKDYEEFVYPYTKGIPPTIARSPPAYAENHPLGPFYPANPRMQLVWLHLQYADWIDYLTGQHEPSLSAILRDTCQLAEPAGTLYNDTIVATKELQEVAKAKIDEKHRNSLFPQFNVSSDWPSVVLVHGVIDPGLPIIDSDHMYSLLKDAGVPAKIYRMEGEEHAFDYSPDAEEKWGQEFDQAIAFIHRATVKKN